MAGLSEAEAKAVTESWAAIKGDWNSTHGGAFLMKLFTTYKDIRAAFPYGALSDAEIESNDKFKGHIIAFGKTVDGLVSSLSDAEALGKQIAKLVDDHIKRNITSMPEFIKAFGCLYDYIVDGTKPSAATSEAWKKTFDAIGNAMAADFKKKGK